VDTQQTLGVLARREASPGTDRAYQTKVLRIIARGKALRRQTLFLVHPRCTRAVFEISFCPEPLSAKRDAPSRRSVRRLSCPFAEILAYMRAKPGWVELRLHSDGHTGRTRVPTTPLKWRDYRSNRRIRLKRPFTEHWVAVPRRHTTRPRPPGPPSGANAHRLVQQSFRHRRADPPKAAVPVSVSRRRASRWPDAAKRDHRSFRWLQCSWSQGCGSPVAQRSSSPGPPTRAGPRHQNGLPESRSARLGRPRRSDSNRPNPAQSAQQM
jgi:hypothetical protein